MYKGKVVVVTGAAQGIGLAIAKAYTELEATVVGFEIQPDMDSDVDSYRVDLGNPDDIEAAFKALNQKYGVVHILINNGAISQFNKSVEEITASEFSRVIDVNLNGSS